MVEDSERIGSAFDKTLANMGGAAVGVWISSNLGPEAGQYISGSVAPWIEELSHLARQTWIRKFQRVQEAGAAASKAAGCPFEDLINQAIGDDRKLQLLTQALNAASMAEDARKVRTLGRAIAAGMDGARVDEQLRIVSTLAALEPVDARVLVLMTKDRKLGWVKRPRQSDNTAGIGVLLESEPTLDSLIDSVVARLETHGLISDSDKGQTFGGLSFGSELHVTAFGELCADSLNEKTSPEGEGEDSGE